MINLTSNKLRVAVFAAFGFLLTQHAIAEEADRSGDLLVSTVDSMTFDGQSVVLAGVGSEVIWFSDRPERKSGTITWGEFTDAWTSGGDSFQNDPPNAVITLDGDVQKPVIVELSNPKVDGGSVTFDATVLLGDLPSSAGAVSIVYDLCWQCIIL